MENAEKSHTIELSDEELDFLAAGDGARFLGSSPANWRRNALVRRRRAGRIRFMDQPDQQRRPDDH